VAGTPFGGGGNDHPQFALRDFRGRCKLPHILPESVPRIAFHCAGFADLVEKSDALADKSMFLYEWFFNHAEDAMMLTLPRGVGKTIVLVGHSLLA
jgi:hypothetical protein